MTGFNSFNISRRSIPKSMARSLARSGTPSSIRIRKRSNCDSGNGKVPTAVCGFCVAITKKGLGQLVGDAVNRDVIFLHRFQKRALCFWGRSVYLVDQIYVRRKWNMMKEEQLLIAVKEGVAKDVGRH